MNYRRVFEPVRSLRPRMIKVRLIRKYILLNSPCEAVGLVFIDKERYCIEATLTSDHEMYLSPQLTEGTWMVIRDFELTEKPMDIYNLTGKYHCMVFTSKTRLMESSYSKEIVRHFHTIHAINHQDIDLTYSIDVVGEIVNVGNFHSRQISRQTRPCFGVSFDLKNNGLLPCRLPNEYSTAFLDSIKRYNGQTILCCIKFARVIVMDRKLTLTTCGNATQIIIDPQIRELDALRTVALPRVL